MPALRQRAERQRLARLLEVPLERLDFLRTLSTSELAGLHQACRNVLRDASTAANGRDVDDSLWSDDALLLYLRDAEEKFVTQTLCLRDSITPAVTQITGPLRDLRCF